MCRSQFFLSDSRSLAGSFFLHHTSKLVFLLKWYNSNVCQMTCLQNTEKTQNSVNKFSHMIINHIDYFQRTQDFLRINIWHFWWFISFNILKPKLYKRFQTFPQYKHFCGRSFMMVFFINNTDNDTNLLLIILN